MIEIKDVIHLYLGCEVEGIEPYYKTMKWTLTGVGKLKCTITCYDISQSALTSAIKPILRDLSSMTEEEKIEMHDHFYPDYQDSSIEHKLNFMALACEKKYTPEHTIWFLKLGIDLFNLHEQGLCLYKSDLK